MAPRWSRDGARRRWLISWGVLRGSLGHGRDASVACRLGELAVRNTRRESPWRLTVSAFRSSDQRCALLIDSGVSEAPPHTPKIAPRLCRESVGCGEVDDTLLLPHAGVRADRLCRRARAARVWRLRDAALLARRRAARAAGGRRAQGEITPRSSREHPRSSRDYPEITHHPRLGGRRPRLSGGAHPGAQLGRGLVPPARALAEGA